MPNQVTSSRIKVLLIDDHALVCKSMATMLDREADMEVVGTLDQADHALNTARRHAVDVIVMDIDMPGLSPFEAAQRIKVSMPDTRILFLSGLSHDFYVEQVLAIGASGYLMKTEEPANVVRAIRAVAQGRTWYSPEIRDRIVLSGEGPRLQRRSQSRVETLTVRELEVLRYVARGFSERDIAQTMALSTATVHNHCTRLMNKLDIHNRVELARFAIRERIVDL